MRVLARPVALDPDVQPYPELLYNAVRSAGIDVAGYRTVDVLRRPPDVIHIHWPEHTLQYRGWRKHYRAFLTILTISYARLRGTALVYTAHNTAPHDVRLKRFDRWYLRAFDRRVDTVLTLTQAGREMLLRERPALAHARFVHTRLGSFRDTYKRPADSASARRTLGAALDRPTLVFAGQVRPYKGVPELLAAARGVDADVIVAGACHDATLRTELEAAAKDNPRVQLRLRVHSPDELATVIAAADVVVLPFRTIFNSSSALLALSLDRPVLVPDLPPFEELRREVGTTWVRLYQGTLQAEDLKAALAEQGAGRPDLRLYEWSSVARDTISAYQASMRRSDSLSNVSTIAEATR